MKQLLDSKRTAWLLFAAVLPVYVLFPTKNFYWDGIDFAHDIEQAATLTPNLLHANHLLYSPFGYLVYRLARWLGADARAVEVLQYANCVLGALCAALLYRVLLAATRSAYVSLCFSVLFAFSATWWKFTTDAASYTLSTLFLVAAFYYLLPGRAARPVVVAVLHASAMLFHQIAVFFYPAAVLGLLLQTTQLPPRRRALAALRYSAAAVALTVAVYFYCFKWKTGQTSPLAFLSWVSSYSSGSGGFTFDFLSNLRYTLRGHVRLFAGGRLTLLEGLLNPFVVALVVILLALIVLLCWRLAKSFGRLKTTLRAGDSTRRPSHVELLSVVWMLPFVLFCFFFYPSDTFHRLVYLPALVILCAAALSRFESGGARNFRLALFAAALALSNFCFYIYPYAHTRNNPPLATALGLREIIAPQSVVFFAQSNGDNRLFRYFNPAAEWKQLTAGDLAALESE
ncbi:MAG TPA: hypothetical protein VEQ42_03015, partial [Pyrinomonadaceae bacterium]|nr:hypothetical protein [Pyrinomonadaceae bacterium]